jgi:hypothetical protein
MRAGLGRSTVSGCCGCRHGEVLARLLHCNRIAKDPKPRNQGRLRLKQGKPWTVAETAPARPVQNATPSPKKHSSRRRPDSDPMAQRRGGRSSLLCQNLFSPTLVLRYGA